MLNFKHATVFLADEILEDGAVRVDDGCIQAVMPSNQLPSLPNSQAIDASGMFLVPGFIDLQINGAFGQDFTRSPKAIWMVAEQLPRHGVTAFLPTIITSPPGIVVEAQRVLDKPPRHFSGSKPLGLHVEGPFLNPAKKGAHNRLYMSHPSPAMVVDWYPAYNVQLVTLAPELPGAIRTIEALCKQGVVVSAGHSLANFEEAQAGISSGIRYGTHLFNAMPALDHYDPGLIGSLMTDERVTIGLIADGVHMHPALVRLISQAIGYHRLNLVTDAMAALEMPAGVYQLGDFAVTVDGISARLENDTLAGSILSLDTALRNLITFTSCTLEEALSTITTVPAKLLGISSKKGEIAPGFDADLVLLSSDLTVMATIVAGEIVFKNDCWESRMCQVL